MFLVPLGRSSPSSQNSPQLPRLILPAAACGQRTNCEPPAGRAVIGTSTVARKQKLAGIPPRPRERPARDTKKRGLWHAWPKAKANPAGLLALPPATGIRFWMSVRGREISFLCGGGDADRGDSAEVTLSRSLGVILFFPTRAKLLPHDSPKNVPDETPFANAGAW